MRDIYEAARRRADPPRPPGARAARLHDPPEPVQAAARPPVGLPRLRRPVVGAAARRPRRLHGVRSTSVSPARSGMKLYKGHARVVTRASPNAVYDAAPRLLLGVGRPLLADRLAGLHRAVVAAVAHGLAAARARVATRETDGSSRGGWKLRGSGSAAGACRWEVLAGKLTACRAAAPDTSDAAVDRAPRRETPTRPRRADPAGAADERGRLLAERRRAAAPGSARRRSLRRAEAAEATVHTLEGHVATCRRACRGRGGASMERRERRR